MRKDRGGTESARAALDLLEEALGHGLLAQIAVNMENDEDLKSLYRDPRFVTIVARAKKNAVSVQQPN